MKLDSYTISTINQKRTIYMKKLISSILLIVAWTLIIPASYADTGLSYSGYDQDQVTVYADFSPGDQLTTENANQIKLYASSVAGCGGYDTGQGLTDTLQTTGRPIASDAVLVIQPIYRPDKIPI